MLRQVVQPDEQRGRYARQHDRVNPYEVEAILQRVYALGAPVEAHAAEPRIGLGVVVQNCPALLRAENLARGKAHALELARAVHAAREPARRVHDRIWAQLIRPAPVLIAPADVETGVPNRARHANVGAPWNVDRVHALRALGVKGPLAGELQRG